MSFRYYIPIPAHFLSMLYYLKTNESEQARFLCMWDIQLLATLVDKYYFKNYNGGYASGIEPSFCAGPGRPNSIEVEGSGKKRRFEPIEYGIDAKEYSKFFKKETMLGVEDLSFGQNPQEWYALLGSLHCKKTSKDGFIYLSLSEDFRFKSEMLIPKVKYKNLASGSHLSKSDVVMGLPDRVKPKDDESWLEFHLRRIFVNVPEQRTGTKITEEELRRFMEDYFSTRAPYAMVGISPAISFNFKFDYKRFSSAFDSALKDFKLIGKEVEYNRRVERVNRDIKAVNDEFYISELTNRIPVLFGERYNFENYEESGN